MWNNKNLTLQIDHINGIHSDNSISNLRFLCPNCHSQAETSFGSKLKGKERLKIRTKENKERIINKIKRYNNLGIVLTINVVSTYDGFLYKEAKQVFGSWNKAVELSGFNYSEIKLLQGWNKQKIIEEMRKIVLENPKISFEQIKEINKGLYDAARRHFGGIRNVFIEMGIDYKTHRRKK
jgi:hypothetical protein